MKQYIKSEVSSPKSGV